MLYEPLQTATAKLNRIRIEKDPMKFRIKIKLNNRPNALIIILLAG